MKSSCVVLAFTLTTASLCIGAGAAIAANPNANTIKKIQHLDALAKKKLSLGRPSPRAGVDSTSRAILNGTATCGQGITFGDDREVKKITSQGKNSYTVVAPTKGGTFEFTMKDGKLQSFLTHWKAKKTHFHSFTTVNPDGTTVNQRHFLSKSSHWQDMGRKLGQN